jgi:hypothetical protein
VASSSSRLSGRDQLFASVQPTWPTGSSIRVKGMVHNQAFDIYLDAEPDFELDVIPAFVVDESGQNLTVKIDVANWFRVGGVTVDPRTVATNSTLRGKVVDNVKKSFDVFDDDEGRRARLIPSLHDLSRSVLSRARNILETVPWRQVECPEASLH